MDQVTEGLQLSVVDRLADVLAMTRRERGTYKLFPVPGYPQRTIRTAALRRRTTFKCVRPQRRECRPATIVTDPF